MKNYIVKVRMRVENNETYRILGAGKEDSVNI